jgi:hypothetical protein
VRFPLVCNTLTGLVAYHPRDNAFMPYRCIMRFIHRFYAVRHRMRQGKNLSVVHATGGRGRIARGAGASLLVRKEQQCA